MDNMAARIVRVWKGYVTADGVQQYCDGHFTKTVLPQLRALEGFLCANVLVSFQLNWPDSGATVSTAMTGTRPGSCSGVTRAWQGLSLDLASAWSHVFAGLSLDCVREFEG